MSVKNEARARCFHQRSCSSIASSSLRVQARPRVMFLFRMVDTSSSCRLSHRTLAVNRPNIRVNIQGARGARASRGPILALVPRKEGDLDATCTSVNRPAGRSPLGNCRDSGRRCRRDGHGCCRDGRRGGRHGGVQ